MLIVDSHTHIGLERLYDVDMKSADLLRVMKENGIQKAIVQPQAGSPDIFKNHRDIADLSYKYPGIIYGVASFNPMIDESEYMKNVTWAINELKFKGIKLHTNGFGISPLNPYSQKVFNAALELGVPVMIHTGTGIPQSLPSMAIPIAKKYPDLSIILAHAGGGFFASEAIIVAQEYKNIFLETSWVSPVETIAMVNQIGADRVMFGSDMYENVPSFLEIYLKSGLPQDIIEKCLGLTAISVFKL